MLMQKYHVIKREKSAVVAIAIARSAPLESAGMFVNATRHVTDNNNGTIMLTIFKPCKRRFVVELHSSTSL